jgi:hypothetical protein
MIRSALRTTREATSPAPPASTSRAASRPSSARARGENAARRGSVLTRSDARARRCAGRTKRASRMAACRRASSVWRTGRPAECRWKRELLTVARASIPEGTSPAMRATAFPGTEDASPVVRIRFEVRPPTVVVAPRPCFSAGASDAMTTRPGRASGILAPVAPLGAVAAAGGLPGSETGVAAGGGTAAGGDAGCSAAGGGAGAGGGLEAGGAAGAGGGLGALRGGSSPSGSTYVSPSPTLIPRWTYGVSCSTSPDGPGSAIAAPSATGTPLRVCSVPRCVSETL